MDATCRNHVGERAAPSKRLQLRAYNGRKHGPAPFHGGVMQPASRFAPEFST